MSEPGSVLTEQPLAPVIAPRPAESSASPFSDPNYGREGEQPGHVIRSHPTWKLEETQTLWTGFASLAAVVVGALCLALIQRSFPIEELLQWATLQPLQDLVAMDTSSLAALIASEAAWCYRVLLLCAGVFFAMAFVEMFVCRIYTRHFDFSAPRSIDASARKRIAERWFALASCFVLAFLAYGVLGEYRFFNFPYPDDWYYATYRTFFLCASVVVPVLAVPYFWLVERYARPDGPHDEFLILARCARRFFRGIIDPSRAGDGRLALRNAHVKNLFIGLLVKFFFVPLMLTWTVGGWMEWERMSHGLLNGWPSHAWASPADIALNLRSVFEAILRFTFTAELTTALIAYICSVRLFDTQVTTAEPTFFGWIVAVCCYPPFVAVTMGSYLRTDWHDVWPVDATIAYPVLSMVCSSLSIILIGIYGWCTFCFALRFSNLTNRGILCCGPYNHVRHPAYICKNTVWLLSLIPVTLYHPIIGLTFFIRQLGTCGIYYLRAITEERHLMREPHYQEYCKKVPWRFIPGIW